MLARLRPPTERGLILCANQSRTTEVFRVCSFDWSPAWALGEIRMLTKKQHELLIYINQRLAAAGVAPSFDEMKDALNLRSKSGIHRLISGLEERGFIRRLAHRARALEVTRLPEESAAASG